MRLIRDLLNAAEVSALRAMAEGAVFESGSKTAGSGLAGVKRNQQAQLDAGSEQRLQSILQQAFSRHRGLTAYAQPRRFGLPLLSRYREGDDYGRHLDQALMGQGSLRADIGMTIFLSDPDSYQGGALVLETETGEAKVKLPAGSAVAYPAFYWHRVETVSSGERLVLVSWVQSYVADPSKRAILCELNEAFETLYGAAQTGPVFDKVQRSYTNLLRLWAEM